MEIKGFLDLNINKKDPSSNLMKYETIQETVFNAFVFYLLKGKKFIPNIVGWKGEEKKIYFLERVGEITTDDTTNVLQSLSYFLLKPTDIRKKEDFLCYKFELVSEIPENYCKKLSGLLFDASNFCYMPDDMENINTQFYEAILCFKGVFRDRSLKKFSKILSNTHESDLDNMIKNLENYAFNPEAICDIGELYEGRGNIPKAYEQYKKGVQMESPRALTLLCQLKLSLLMCNNTDDPSKILTRNKGIIEEIQKNLKMAALSGNSDAAYELARLFILSEKNKISQEIESYLKLALAGGSIKAFQMIANNSELFGKTFEEIRKDKLYGLFIHPYKTA